MVKGKTGQDIAAVCGRGRPPGNLLEIRDRQRFPKGCNMAIA
jgi:hypothetical protein